MNFSHGLPPKEADEEKNNHRLTSRLRWFQLTAGVGMNPLEKISQPRFSSANSFCLPFSFRLVAVRKARPQVSRNRAANACNRCQNFSAVAGHHPTFKKLAVGLAGRSTKEMENVRWLFPLLGGKGQDEGGRPDNNCRSRREEALTKKVK